MNRLAAFALSCSLVIPASAAAQHEDHGKADPSQIGSASVKFETTCAAAVRDDFNRAVALLHSFWFPEATKTFEAIAQKDPTCAMAHWGIAMSAWGNPYGGLRSAELIAKGKVLADKAQATGSPSPREKALIDAVAGLYSSTDPATQRDRVVKYEAAMEKIANDNPNDIEVRIFYALSVSQSAVPTDKTSSIELTAQMVLGEHLVGSWLQSTS